MSSPGASLSLCVIIMLALFSCVACQNSTVDNDEMGMNSLYTMVNTFLGDIVHKKQLTDSFLNLSTVFVDGHFDKDALTDWNKWADYLIGFAVCIGIGLVFIVVMPIVGIIFCCCRLCGRCGARKKLQESKRAKCKRRSYCTLLVILNTLTLAGVVCAFICNSLVYTNLQNKNNDGSIGHIKSGIGQLNSFLNNSVEDASVYVLHEFDNTRSSILTQINVTAGEVVDDVLQELNATYYLDQAKSVNEMANNTKQKLDEVSQVLLLLQNKTEELQDSLTGIKDNIEIACQANSCSGFNAADYTTNANFSSLKTLSDIANNVTQTLDMSTFIQEAEDSINTSTEEARSEVKKQTEEAEKAVDNVRKQITDGLVDLKEQKDDALQFVPDAYKELDTADDKINDFYKYGYYTLIGVCSVFLLIVALYYIGILFGLCGEKPGHGAPCCNTGAGANFLMAGVAFTFIFSWLLMLVCTVMFTISGPVYTELCRTFIDHDPQQLKVLDDVLLEGLNLENIFKKGVPPGFTISGALRKCEKNQAVFSALDLDYVVNLDDIMNIADLEDELNRLKTSTITVPNITIIGPDLEKKLLDLTTSGLEDFDYAPYYAELGKELTNAPLTDLAEALQNISSPMQPSNLKQVLDNSTAQLLQLNNQVIPDIMNEMIILNNTLKDLQEDNTLNSTIYKLVDDLKQAQEKFNSEKQTLISEQITKLADEILTLANNSINSVTTQIRTKLYGCRPLNDAVYTMTDAVCKLVVNPVNGMWFSFGWCLFFFIPSLVFAVLLTSQYRREHEYEKEYEDTNYMMYGGNNHDTIPLTSLDQPGHSSSVGNIPPHHHHYPGHTNLAYTHDAKVSDRHHQQLRQLPPPPYEAHMQPGIAAYAPPPPQHYGHKHHDLAHQYPALHADRDRNKTSYPY